MAGRGFAAVLVIAVALVTLIGSGGAGAQSGDSIQCDGGTGSTTVVDGVVMQTCTITATPGRCIEKSSSPEVVQTCIVNQSEPKNEVYVEQVNNSDEQGTTQDATQTTTINQQGTDNKATVKQDMKQSTHESGSTTQTQDGDQITTICQGLSGGPCATTPNDGVNVANVQQSRWADAHASGGTIVQMQDATPGACSRNVCADITQSSTVRNDTALHQDIHLLAEASGTTGSSVTQKQGFAAGGIDGNVVQPSTTARNTNDTHQHLTYDLSAPQGATQNQDPRIACCTPQGSGKSKTNLHQVGILRAGKDAFQHLGINGNCISNGSCLVLEHGKVNGANFSTRCSADGSCERFIDCTSTSEGAACTGGPPIDIDLASAGFDTLDFQDAINFTFPLSVPLGL